MTNPDLMTSSGCRELGLSDHSMIYGVLTEVVERQKPCLRHVRCFRNIEVDTVVEHLKLAPWQVMDSLEDVNCQWEFWKKLFKSVIDSLIPLKKARVKRRTLPWISHDIRVLMRARNYYCKKARRSKREEDWMQYRCLRHLVTQKLRKEKLKFFEDVSEKTMRNPRMAWKELNRLLGRGKRKQIDVVRTGEDVVTEKKSIADEFCKYFSSIVGDVLRDSDETDAHLLVPAVEDDFHFQRIKEEDVLRILKSLDTSKAVGVDMVSAKLLKLAAEGISQSLTSLFNSSLESGQIPLEWKAANVTPVPKGGDSEFIENFRPVSVLPVVVNMFEKLVHQQLFAYLLEHDILHSAQSGFRPGHTTQGRGPFIQGWVH